LSTGPSQCIDKFVGVVSVIADNKTIFKGFTVESYVLKTTPFEIFVGIINEELLVTVFHVLLKSLTTEYVLSQYPELYDTTLYVLSQYPELENTIPVMMASILPLLITSDDKLTLFPFEIERRKLEGL
jgi:hypothetical protein